MADEGQDAGDLFAGFESYCTPTKADYESLFSEGMIVVDANVLLDLYLYHEKTRDDFLRVLGEVQDRLWVPHQAVKEFWKNRDSKLRDPRESDAASRDLKSRSDEAVKDLRTWSNRVRMPRADVDRLADTISQAFGTVIEEVKKLAADDGREFARDIDSDPLLLALKPLLQGRVGLPFSNDDYEKAVKEAIRRIVNKLPPGYMDANKDDKNAVGDYLIWAQLLREAENRKLDVLFVTSDDKEDWWRKDKDKRSLGPRPELADELMQCSGRRLFMLPPDSLLYWARTILNIDVSDESVQEVKQVSATAGVNWRVNLEGFTDRELVLIAHNRMRALLASAAKDDPKIEGLLSNVETNELARQYLRYVVQRDEPFLQDFTAALDRDQKFTRDAVDAVERQQADARRIEEEAAERNRATARLLGIEPESGQ